ANGEGKTNLLEALGWLATLGSFRGAPTEALVRRSAPFAIVRAAAERGGRDRADRAPAAAEGPQQGAGEPPAAAPGPGPAGLAAGHGVHARRPGGGEGRAGGTAPHARRRACQPPSPS